MNNIDIKSNIDNVKSNINQVCLENNIDPSLVELIAVSKTKPVDMLMQAYDAGIRDFGENYIQELVDKIDIMPKDIRWHMIGHLQTNKVKYIVGKVYLIHGVDSLKLAQQISKESVKKNVTSNILIEVNVAEEDSKFGITDSESVVELVREAAKLPNISIKGLMTIAPFTENAEENRKYFMSLKKLSVDISRENIDNIDMSVLSMGMTGDYLVAVSEGATYVRVGTGIFGERDYSK